MVFPVILKRQRGEYMFQPMSMFAAAVISFNAELIINTNIVST